MCQAQEVYQSYFQKGKTDYCRAIQDDLLIQCLNKYHYHDLYRRQQQYQEAIRQLRPEISGLLMDRLLQNLGRLSPNYETFYQSFKSLNQLLFSTGRQKLSVSRLGIATQVGSILRLKSACPMRLSAMGSIPVVRQFKQIFQHIISKNIFIPRNPLTVAEIISMPVNVCFLKPDTILLSPRATVFDLMAGYMRFIECYNERLITNISAFRVKYPHPGTDVLANGVIALFSDPVGLANSCRDYFNFTIAALRGDLA